MEELRDKFDAAMTNVMRGRKALLEAKENTIAIREALKDQECALVGSGAYTASGTNEKAREAWLRSQTERARLDLSQAESDERVAVLALETALDARRNLESILKIVEME